MFWLWVKINVSNSKCEQKHLIIYGLKQPVLIAPAGSQRCLRSETCNDTICSRGAVMLHLQRMYRKWHVGPPVPCCCSLAPWWADTCSLTHFQPFSGDFQENPWSDIIILCCDTMGFAIFISLLQPPIVNGVLLNSVMNEEKETLGKMKISPCVLNASKIWDSCVEWM